MNGFARGKAFLILLALMVLGLCAMARAENIALGSNYYQTTGGSTINLGGSIGSVNLTGLPIGPGNTDTIIQRQADAIVSPGGTAAPIPIQITALSLESTVPVNIGGSFFDVFLTLDPAHLADDTGTMTISEDLTGHAGTFASILNLYYEAIFTPISSGSAPDIFGSIALSNSGSPWSNTPPPGAVIVNGVDEGAGDQAANLHSGLDTGGSFGLPAEEDFFTSGSATTTTPEPSSLLLLGTGLAALVGMDKRRAFRQK